MPGASRVRQLRCARRAPGGPARTAGTSAASRHLQASGVSRTPWPGRLGRGRARPASRSDGSARSSPKRAGEAARARVVGRERGPLRRQPRARGDEPSLGRGTRSRCRRAFPDCLAAVRERHDAHRRVLDGAQLARGVGGSRLYQGRAANAGTASTTRSASRSRSNAPATQADLGEPGGQPLTSRLRPPRTVRNTGHRPEERGETGRDQQAAPALGGLGEIGRHRRQAEAVGRPALMPPQSSGSARRSTTSRPKRPPTTSSIEGSLERARGAGRGRGRRGEPHGDSSRPGERADACGHADTSPSGSGRSGRGAHTYAVPVAGATSSSAQPDRRHRSTAQGTRARKQSGPLDRQPRTSR